MYVDIQRMLDYVRKHNKDQQTLLCLQLGTVHFFMETSYHHKKALSSWAKSVKNATQ